MMILIHKICMAFKGFGYLNNVEIAINDKAAILIYKIFNKFSGFWYLNNVEIAISDKAAILLKII